MSNNRGDMKGLAPTIIKRGGQDGIKIKRIL